MIFEEITETKKTLELKIGESTVKIHLKAPDFRTEQYIVSLDAIKPTTQEEADRKLAEFVARLIRAVVTGVEGIQFRDESKKITDFVIEQDSNGDMTVECYTKFMRVLNHMPEAIQLIQKFYIESTNSKIAEGTDTKK